MEHTDPEGAVLVVGGGSGGMRAALDLAKAGLKVYLVEREVGGGNGQAGATQHDLVWVFS